MHPAARLGGATLRRLLF